jgi:hypothetical protein
MKYFCYLLMVGLMLGACSDHQVDPPEVGPVEVSADQNLFSTKPDDETWSSDGLFSEEEEIIIGTYDSETSSISLNLTQAEFDSVFVEAVFDEEELTVTFDTAFIDDEFEPGYVPYLIFRGYKADGSSYILGIELEKVDGNYIMIPARAWKCEGVNCNGCKPTRTNLVVTGCICVGDPIEPGASGCNHSSSGGGSIWGLVGALVGLIGALL